MYWPVTPLGFRRRFMVLAAVLIAAVSPAVARAQIAVIVHRGSPLANVSTDELSRIFLGSTQSLGEGTAIALIECAPLRDKFYRALLGKSESRMKRHWIQLVFSGEIATPPSQFAEEADVRKYVATHPGAVGFVSLASVDASVRAIVIDGVAPNNPNYRIR